MDVKYKFDRDAWMKIKHENNALSILHFFKREDAYCDKMQPEHVQFVY